VVSQPREDLAHPLRSVASPIRLSQTPVAYRSPPPVLGADTEAVLGERLGLSGEDLARLRSGGLI